LCFVERITNVCGDYVCWLIRSSLESCDVSVYVYFLVEMVASFVEVTTHLFTTNYRNCESAECELLHGFTNVLSLSVVLLMESGNSYHQNFRSYVTILVTFSVVF